jgi:hypothetical protein
MDFDPRSGGPRRTIGFGIPIRLEEEEDQGATADRLRPGRAAVSTRLSPEAAREVVDTLLEERRLVTRLLTEKKIEKDDALKLLADNRELILFMQGGSPYKFATEKVIYWLLAFSATITVTLATLHALGKLEAAVMTTFVGTTVGGTLTTIAQKLGKVGR